MTIHDIITDICKKAADNQHHIAHSSHQTRNNILRHLQDILQRNINNIITENNKDVAYAHDKNLSDAMIDRLVLNEARVNAMIDGLEHIIAQPDPLHATLQEWQRDNGLSFTKISVPLGIIGIIYESRPNVTIDAAALCLKSGNGAILRGGSESYHSSSILTHYIQESLQHNMMNHHIIAMVPTRDRGGVQALLTMDNYIDVLVPRGGKNLIKTVQDNARMPIFSHLDGNCHLYVDNAADQTMVDSLIYNAKLRRMGICGALESLVVHKEYGDKIISALTMLHDANVTIKGDDTINNYVSFAQQADESDYYTEYLGPTISVKVVNTINEATHHINHYGSHHTDGIITNNTEHAAFFMQQVNSAICVHNASTQFADGYEFGFGGEIGIATGKMHARGPVGAAQLTTYKYCVTGHGTIRP